MDNRSQIIARNDAARLVRQRRVWERPGTGLNVAALMNLSAREASSPTAVAAVRVVGEGSPRGSSPPPPDCACAIDRVEAPPSSSHSRIAARARRLVPLAGFRVRCLRVGVRPPGARS